MTRTKMDLIRSLPAIALGDGWFIRVNSCFSRRLGFGHEISRTIRGTCTAFVQIVQSFVQDENTQPLRGAGQPFQVGQ
jgi:hypothetical protein